MEIDPGFAVSFTKLAIDVFVKSVVLLVICGLMLKIFRYRPASFHSLALNIVIFSLVLLPLMLIITPEWRVPLLPNPAAAVKLGSAQTGLPIANQISVAPDKGLTENPSKELTALQRWPLWFLSAWLIGAIGCLLWQLLGDLSLRWILRKAQPLRGDRQRALLEELCKEADINRTVQLYQSGEINTALISGVFRNKVVLPQSSLQWSDQQLIIVLSHELAHIRRRDSLIEIPAKIALILYWCNPLVWLIVRQLRIERERACDNAVLNAGVKPSAYATQLMEVAADLGAFRKPLWQEAAISEGSGLKDRLLCILDPKLDRKPIRQHTGVAVAILIAVALLLLSPVTIWCNNPYRSQSVASETESFNRVIRSESATLAKTLSNQRITELITLLNDECNDVRFDAVNALSMETCNHSVVTALRKTLQDPAPEVRQKVAELLSGIDNKIDARPGK